MLNRDGKFLIDKITERLVVKEIPCFDSNIVKELRKMDKYQVSQLVNMGDVSDWKWEEGQWVKE